MTFENNILRHDHDDEEDSYQAVLIAKISAALVLFLVPMILGLIPLYGAKYFGASGNLRNNPIVVALLSFAGGVLLGSTFLHLIPEVEHHIEHLIQDGLMRDFDFPITPLITCSGFFMMYLIEELVHLYLSFRSSKTNAFVRNMSIRRSGRTSINNGEASITNSTATLVDAESQKKGKDVESRNHDNGHGHGHSHAGGHGHSHMPVEVGDDVTSALRGLLVVLALSIHELFEGLAIGLASSSGTVWVLLGAVASHKLILAFCIGVELVATETKRWLSIIYVAIFAVVSPLGITVGIILVGGEGAAAGGVFSVVLEGLASGTLIYVIFFEIWSGERSGMVPFLAALLGFCVMFGLELLTGHSHSHSHSHNSALVNSGMNLVDNHDDEHELLHPHHE